MYSTCRFLWYKYSQGQFQACNVIIVWERCTGEAAPTSHQAPSSLPESSPFLAAISGFPAPLAPDSWSLSPPPALSASPDPVSVGLCPALRFVGISQGASLLFGFPPTMVDFENSSIHRFSESRSTCKTLKSTFLTPISHILHRLLLWGADWGAESTMINTLQISDGTVKGCLYLFEW